MKHRADSEIAPPQDAMAHAMQVQEAAARCGFNWPEADGVLDKLHEEIEEIREALREGDAESAVRELGDVLLASTNLAQFLNCDPSDALQNAAARFSRRFSCVKETLAGRGLAPEKCSLEELDAVWNEVKHQADKQVEQAS